MLKKNWKRKQKLKTIWRKVENKSWATTLRETLSQAPPGLFTLLHRHEVGPPNNLIKIFFIIFSIIIFLLGGPPNNLILLIALNVNITNPLRGVFIKTGELTSADNLVFVKAMQTTFMQSHPAIKFPSVTLAWWVQIPMLSTRAKFSFIFSHASVAFSCRYVSKFDCTNNWGISCVQLNEQVCISLNNCNSCRNSWNLWP